MNGGEPRTSQDEDLRQAWHAASDESPPPHVDTAILAAARDAAQRPGRADVAKRSRPWYREWQPMLAAAAIAGLAFALLQTMPREIRHAMPLDASAPAAAPPESPGREMAQDRAEPVGKVEQQARRDASPVARAEMPAGTESEGGSLTFNAQLESGRARKSAAGVEQRTAPAAAAAPAPPPDVADSMMSESPPAVASRERAAVPEDDEATAAGLQADAAQTAVEARIERIVTLYRSGDKAGAATELRALRADTEGVDGRLPPELRAWARTVH